jgi:predicted nucleic acid-binding protein
MKTWVLDASAVLRFTDGEPGFEHVRDLYAAAAKGEIQLLMSAVNWGEVVLAVLRRSRSDAQSILDNLTALPMKIVPVDAAAASRAAYFKFLYRVPYADAFAGDLALLPFSEDSTEMATLVTADNDFRTIPKTTLAIEFLAGK